MENGSPESVLQTLTPTVRCNGTPPTPALREGPYYKPDTPLRTSFRGDVDAGVPMLLHGAVRTPDGEPIGGTLLDFWQVGEAGVYDGDGFRLRGHQFADAEGQWRLETVLPAMYPGRTRHVHVKVQPPGGAVLTTMLYFPGERRNHLDKYFRPECLMDVVETPEGLNAAFTFILNV
ncbi:MULTISPECIES: dioxygenase family protein [unclassified Streptomyces]|uniref:dioxygenase family protein n=1 Tax=Streptomyces sp. NPDC055082 TaxID=3365718 RepID=UPI0037CDB5BF